jgi:hypothetical protein
MFLYKALLARVQLEGLIVVAIATSGIAHSSVDIAWRTHCTFKVKIQLNLVTTTYATLRSKVALQRVPIGYYGLYSATGNRSLGLPSPLATTYTGSCWSPGSHHLFL